MSVSSRTRTTEAGAPAFVIEWEEPDCLLCGSRRSTVLIEAPDATPGSPPLLFTVRQCLDCSLCYTSPRPSPSTIGPFYPDTYPPHRLRPDRAVRPVRVVRPWAWPRKERQTLPWQGEGRLLDFGCGSGSYLERMHRQGWQVIGLDVSDAAVERVREELGLPVLAGSLPHPALDPASLDVITMWHSLEHVHSPLEVLREARRLLAPGGTLLVAVPNIDSLPFHWFGPNWYGLDLPRHLTHFSPATLRLMVEAAGFRCDRLRMVRHSDWMRSSAKRACRTGQASRFQRWLRIKPASRLATWYTSLRGKADCMLLTARAD